MKVNPDKDVSKIRACVIDHGLFYSFAERLARTFADVTYFVEPTEELFPLPNKAMIGEGFDDVRRVHDLYKAIREADLIITPDVFHGPLLNHCRDDLGKACWGAGSGEEFELDRWLAKQTLKDAGLPYNPTDQVEGIAALRKYFQKHENKVLKLSRWRGIGETFKHKNYDLSKPKIDEMAYRLGPWQELITFYVEDVIESETEPGYDGYCVDGQFPSTAIVGYEVKDKSGVSSVVPYTQVYKGLRDINDALSPHFKKLRYRGPFSTEARVSKDRKCFPTDLTCRHATPMGEIVQELIKNLPLAVWRGANGFLEEPEWSARYAAQVMITSTWAERDHQPLYYPEKISQWVKPYNCCRLDGVTHIIPQDAAHLKEIGSVVGIGNTIDQAITNCKRHAEQVEGYLVCANTSDLDEAAAVIAKGEKAGVRFGERLRAA